MGFPAHAGMDPAPSCRHEQLHGLPRTRGDGPLPLFGVRLGHGASPHTRGWTGAEVELPPARPGFPAHAGMDRARPPRARAFTRLPRTRGDGPRCQYGCDGCSRASPHTRGWTVGRLFLRRITDGFPAHAGMDPVLAGLWEWVPGLPRTRGDGPVRQAGGAVVLQASPHTRGWTLLDFASGSPGGGFPAHAGMDPCIT